MTRAEVARPSEFGVDPWFLLGWLSVQLEARGRVDVAEWNAAVEAAAAEARA